MTDIDFPDSPADGLQFDLWKWSAARSVWDWDVVPGPVNVEYVVVAGGGGAGTGGGGAGGYRANVSGENSGGGALA